MKKGVVIKTSMHAHGIIDVCDVVTCRLSIFIVRAFSSDDVHMYLHTQAFTQDFTAGGSDRLKVMLA